MTRRERARRAKGIGALLLMGSVPACGVGAQVAGGELVFAAGAVAALVGFVMFVEARFHE